MHIERIILIIHNYKYIHVSSPDKSGTTTEDELYVSCVAENGQHFIAKSK